LLTKRHGVFVVVVVVVFFLPAAPLCLYSFHFVRLREGRKRETAKIRIPVEVCIQLHAILSGLLVRVHGCRPKGPGFERGPLSLVRINEELLEGKSSGSGLEN
jgi:hypothetical protein